MYYFEVRDITNPTETSDSVTIQVKSCVLVDCATYVDETTTTT